MSLLHLVGCSRTLLIGLIFFVIALPSPRSSAESLSLTDASMMQAIGYYGVLAGRDLSTDDAAWLKQQWSEAFEATPEAVAAQVDNLALAFQRYQRDKDPLALAQGRATVLKTIYCAMAQTSDPSIHRLKNILAPSGVVLAADCVLGLVVTGFDADGLVASHALLAAIAGKTHDAKSDKVEVLTTIETGFADAAPNEKGVLANGELRHAVLARYWSQIEGSQKQRAFIDEVGNLDLADLRSPARQLENLALRSLGDVDYVAKVGDTRLKGSDIGIINGWLERIAGQGFDGKDRDWLQQVIVDEFRRDPQKILAEISGLQQMNRDHILAETDDEKREMVRGWATGLYCNGSMSDDPNERRLVALVFRHDPVVDADCQAERITRKRHQVLAETNGARLLEQDIDLSLRFARMILARRLLPEEEAIVREDNVQSFKRGPDAWWQQNEQYRTVLAGVEKHDSDYFLATYERKKLFDPLYCALKQSDEPYADDYLAMFRRNDAIVHEDCDRQVVTTRDEIDAFIGFGNFLRLLNGRPPFDHAETNDIRHAVASQDLDSFESKMSAIREWWSLLNLNEKATQAQKVREEGITPEGDGSKVDFFVKNVQLQLANTKAMRRNCELERVMAGGDAALFAARSGGYLLSERGGELGYPGSDLENMVFADTLNTAFCG